MKNQKLTWYEVKERNLLNKMSRENKQKHRDFNEDLENYSKEFKENHRAAMERLDRLDKAMDKNREQIGGISRSNGTFCEEYFINSFKENPMFLGERFDYVLDYHKPYPVVIQDEYDLVLHNGATVVIIEVKYKAGLDDVGKTFSKLHTFRTNFPMFKDYKIYLGLASFSFSKAMRARADKEGVVLIQQRGDKIEVVSENIRTW